jgi:glutathione S-transferase
MNEALAPDLQVRFRLFGTVGSPYALKLRSLLRYRRLPFDWVPASLDWTPATSDRAAISQVASRAIKDVQPPVLPVVYFPGDRSYRNDSTLIAYALERCSLQRTIIPRDEGFAFLSHLLEDMADEWGVKIAFQFRWGNESDRKFKSRVVTGELLGGGFSTEFQRAAAAQFEARQVSRMPLVGCTPENAPLLHECFKRVLAACDETFQETTFLFGETPVLADFGWYGQLESLATDPTSRSLMTESAPAVFSYLQLLEDASGIESTTDTDHHVPRGTMRLLHLAGEVYLPFLYANAQALSRGKQSFSLSALGFQYEQKTFRYQGKCWDWLRQEFHNLPRHARSRIEAALRESGCLGVLTRD